MSRFTTLAALLVLCGGLAIAPGCAGARRKPQGQTLSIYVSRYDDSLLFATAAAVQARKAVNPCLWLVRGDVFTDKTRASISDGDWQVGLLDRAGVDAVAAGPEWLQFGAARVRRLADVGRFYVLCANVADSTGQTFGHPFLVRKPGEATVGLAAVTLDSTDILLRVAGARWTSPALAARRTQALVGQRVDVVILAYAPNSADTGFRLEIGAGIIVPIPAFPAPGRVVRVDLDLVSGAVSGFRVEEEDVAPYLSDLSVRTLRDSVHRSWLARPDPDGPLPRPGLDAARSTSAMVKALLKAKEADGFLADSSLFRAGLQGDKPGVSQAGLASLLFEPGRLALLSIPGSELAALPGLTLAPGLSLSKVKRAQSYKVGTTVGFLRRHPELAARGFALSERPLWTICFNLLESRAIK